MALQISVHDSPSCNVISAFSVLESVQTCIDLRTQIVTIKQKKKNSNKHWNMFYKKISFLQSRPAARISLLLTFMVTPLKACAPLPFLLSFSKDQLYFESIPIQSDFFKRGALHIIAVVIIKEASAESNVYHA